MACQCQSLELVSDLLERNLHVLDPAVLVVHLFFDHQGGLFLDHIPMLGLLLFRPTLLAEIVRHVWGPSFGLGFQLVSAGLSQGIGF